MAAAVALSSKQSTIISHSDLKSIILSKNRVFNLRMVACWTSHVPLIGWVSYAVTDVGVIFSRL